nr:BRO family protein [Endobacter medicaginis]
MSRKCSTIFSAPCFASHRIAPAIAIPVPPPNAQVSRWRVLVILGRRFGSYYGRHCITGRRDARSRHSASADNPKFTFSPSAGINHDIRTIEIEGAPWFVAHDVCATLKLGISHTGYVNVWNGTQTLSRDEKRVLRRTDPCLTRGSEVLFGSRVVNVSLISESGLYKLVMRSDKREARLFQDWVTRVVLPTIRQTGAYVVGEEKLTLTL